MENDKRCTVSDNIFVKFKWIKNKFISFFFFDMECEKLIMDSG